MHSNAFTPIRISFTPASLRNCGHAFASPAFAAPMAEARMFPPAPDDRPIPEKGGSVLETSEAVRLCAISAPHAECAADRD